MAVDGTAIVSVSSVVVMAGMGHEEETDVMECKEQWAQEDPPE